MWPHAGCVCVSAEKNVVYGQVLCVCLHFSARMCTFWHFRVNIFVVMKAFQLVSGHAITNRFFALLAVCIKIMISGYFIYFIYFTVLNHLRFLDPPLIQIKLFLLIMVGVRIIGSNVRFLHSQYFHLNSLWNDNESCSQFLFKDHSFKYFLDSISGSLVSTLKSFVCPVEN